MAGQRLSLPLALVVADTAASRARWQRVLEARARGRVRVAACAPAQLAELALPCPPACALVEDSGGCDVWDVVDRVTSLGAEPGRIAVILTTAVPAHAGLPALLGVAEPGEPESLSDVLLAVDGALRSPPE